MKRHVIALADCDSFYVSCERKDNPALSGKPVCVMTTVGNKGIVVSRSREVKVLGIKIGTPYFQIKDVYRQVICIPARMHRYAEISKAVMDIIKTFSPDVEVTSVDEAFIDLTGLNKVHQTSYTDIIRTIRQTIWDKVGVPVSIGLSTSKILAKLASDKAKSNGGIFVVPPDRILETVGDTVINEVCGIGPGNARKMQSYGIRTVRGFVERDDAWVRKAFGINGSRLRQELMGVASSLVKSEPSAPQSIQVTRSFADFTRDLEFIRHALNGHVHEACQKMRRWNGFCDKIKVMLRTKDFKYHAIETKLSNLTNSDFIIRETAQKLLTELYRQNIPYRSTGITLLNLAYDVQNRQSLFDEINPVDDKLSHTIDALESRFGKGIVRVGA